MGATLTNPGNENWSGASLQARIMDATGREVNSATLATDIDLATGAHHKVAANAWIIPSSQTPGTYSVELTLAGNGGKLLARTTTEIAVNDLPASLLVICAHEGDEQAFAGLIRAAVEDRIPAQVLILGAGNVGPLRALLWLTLRPQ